MTETVFTQDMTNDTNKISTEAADAFGSLYDYLRQDAPQDGGEQHVTHVERDGRGYYWWCEADDCDGNAGRYAGAMECEDSARNHEQDAVSASAR